MKSAQRILSLIPHTTDFQESIRLVIHEVLGVVLHPPTFSQDNDLKIFTQGNQITQDDDENPIDLEQVTLNDPSFLLDMREIQEGINIAFQIAMEWVETLEKYREICLETPPEEHDYHLTNANKFLELLEMYNEQIKLFNDIPSQMDIGIIRVDCQGFKKDVTPIPKERLKFIQITLPEMAHKVQCFFFAFFVFFFVLVVPHYGNMSSIFTIQTGVCYFSVHSLKHS